jgi:hypothetical protein
VPEGLRRVCCPSSIDFVADILISWERTVLLRCSVLWVIVIALGLGITLGLSTGRKENEQ